MKLECLGSGSDGNCYLLENNTECLVIDAGLPFMEVKKALNFNISKIVGVVVSHSHGDHAKYIHEYEKAGIPVFRPYDGMETMAMPNNQFMIQAFDLTDKDGHFKHNNPDGSECPCYGYLISHPEIGNFVYATDTELIKWRFKNLNHILVEANYSMEYVDKDKPNYEHVLRGHMNIDTTLGFLKANNNPQLRTVTLCHLSSQNADSSDFKRRANQVVDCDVYVAEKGKVINLDLIPF